MRTTVIILFTLVMAIVVITEMGCYYDKEEILYPQSATINCTGINAQYSTGIKPIMENKCATDGCHNAATAAGGTVLETYAQVAAKAAAINLRCVVQKNMPPGTPLTQAEIATLKCWIDSGTLNN